MVPAIGTKNGGYLLDNDPGGDDIEIIAGNCTGKRGRCAGNRCCSNLCRIGCDAVGHAVHTRVSRHVPRLHWLYSSLCLWLDQTTPAALARNREGVAKFVKLLETGNAGVRAYAESLGLKIDWKDPGSTLSPLASITQVPKAFDFENSHWPSQFHHTGPFHDGKGREDVDFPWERLTEEPFIYASMGTILNGRVDVFRTIVAALAKHKDLQLVLSVGDQVDSEQIGPVPNNAIIVKRAPQLELLKHASVCILTTPPIGVTHIN
jgi:hypothetical protein